MLDAVTTAYFVLSILGGQVLLPLVLGTCLISKRVHRHPLLLEFLACWTVYSLATCILLYSGHQEDAEIPHTLCLAQAALVNGSLIMSAIAAFTLVLHLRITMPLSNNKLSNGLGPRGQFLLSCTPPLAFVVYGLALLGIELVRPGTLQAERRDLICGFRSTGATYLADRISPIIIVVCLLASLGMSSFMFTMTFSARKAVTSRSASAPWMLVLLRFTIFAAYGGLTAIVCMCRIALPDSPALHTAVAVYVATLPLAAFLVFGTLPDVLEVWHLRRRSAPTDSIAARSATHNTHIASDWDARPGADTSTRGSRWGMPMSPAALAPPTPMSPAHRVSVRWDISTPQHPNYPPGLGPPEKHEDEVWKNIDTELAHAS